jgi:type III secretion system needle length determinant
MPQVNTPQTVTPDPSYEEITQDAAEPTLSADPSSVKAFNELLKKSAGNAQDQLQISPQWTPFTAPMFKDDTTTGVPLESKNTAEDATGTLPLLSNASKMFTQTTTQHPDKAILKEGTPLMENKEATPMLSNEHSNKTAILIKSAENNGAINITNKYSDNANGTFASTTKVENEFLAPHTHTHSTFTDKSASVTTGKIPAENRPAASQVDETAYATQNNPLPVGLPSSISSGDTILNNLQSFSQTSSTTALDHSHRLQQIKTELVDQILISSNALENKQAVKIALNPQLLAGTEVNLQKQGNNLQVTFVTTNVQSETFLVNTHTNLQTHLVERLNHFQDISVSVNGTKGNTASGQGQPQDGRSRNRYEYQTPEDNE